MTVLIVLVRRHRRAVGGVARWAMDDEVPGAVEEETGPAAVRRVPPGLLDALEIWLSNIRLDKNVLFEDEFKYRQFQMTYGHTDRCAAVIS